jgi:hypothetical protein
MLAPIRDACSFVVAGAALCGSRERRECDHIKCRATKSGSFSSGVAVFSWVLRAKLFPLVLVRQETHCMLEKGSGIETACWLFARMCNLGWNLWNSVALMGMNQHEMLWDCVCLELYSLSYCVIRLVRRWMGNWRMYTMAIFFIWMACFISGVPRTPIVKWRPVLVARVNLELILVDFR